MGCKARLAAALQSVGVRFERNCRLLLSNALLAQIEQAPNIKLALGSSLAPPLRQYFADANLFLGKQLRDFREGSITSWL